MLLRARVELRAICWEEHCQWPYCFCMLLSERSEAELVLSVCLYTHARSLACFLLQTWETRHAELTMSIAQASVWRQQSCTHAGCEFLTYGKSFPMICPAPMIQRYIYLGLMSRLDVIKPVESIIASCWTYWAFSSHLFLFHVHLIAVLLVNVGGLQHEEWHKLLRSFIYLRGKYGDQRVWVLLFHQWTFVCTLRQKYYHLSIGLFAFPLLAET